MLHVFFSSFSMCVLYTVHPRPTNTRLDSTSTFLDLRIQSHVEELLTVQHTSYSYSGTVVRPNSFILLLFGIERLRMIPPS